MVSAVAWLGAVPSFRPRVVIAAPHPDDEVLGCAGIMSWLGESRLRPRDRGRHRRGRVARRGAAASPATRWWSAGSSSGDGALRELGLGQVPVASARVRGRRRRRERSRARRRARGSARSRHDVDRAVGARRPPRSRGGGPGRAAAAHRAGAACLEVPIWARVRGRRCSPSFVLGLGELAATASGARPRPTAASWSRWVPTADGRPGRASRRARRAHVRHGMAGGGAMSADASAARPRTRTSTRCGRRVRIPGITAGASTSTASTR